MLTLSEGTESRDFKKVSENTINDLNKGKYPILSPYEFCSNQLRLIVRERDSNLLKAISCRETVWPSLNC